jgi:molecular chaperone GrpE
MTKKKDINETIEDALKNTDAEKEITAPANAIPTEEYEELQKKFNNLNDTHLRLMAEFDNYRKRTMKEKADLLKSAGEGVLVNVLPLVDDFERGIKATENSTDITAVREGMMLIYDKFISFLNQNGVKVIETNELPFDTEFHEAITTIPAPTEELKGKVIDCVQKGYTMNEKVIRFSKVVVGE